MLNTNKLNGNLIIVDVKRVLLVRSSLNSIENNIYCIVVSFCSVSQNLLSERAFPSSKLNEVLDR